MTQQMPQPVPMWLKVIYTIFMLVMIPVYWHYYGPTNFLYFCDVALILTLIGIWKNSSLLISMCAVGIIIPQAFWVLDFLLRFMDLSFTGVTAYMFKSESSLFLRGLSLFHGWLPFLLLYLVYKMKYDRRAVYAWSILSAALVLTAYFFTSPPDPNAGLAPVNINYAWGIDDGAAQTWMSPYLWLLVLIIGMPVVFYIPAHFILKKLWGKVESH